MKDVIVFLLRVLSRHSSIQRAQDFNRQNYSTHVSLSVINYSGYCKYHLIIVTLSLKKLCFSIKTIVATHVKIVNWMLWIVFILCNQLYFLDSFLGQLYEYTKIFIFTCEWIYAFENLCFDMKPFFIQKYFIAFRFHYLSIAFHDKNIITHTRFWRHLKIQVIDVLIYHPSCNSKRIIRFKTCCKVMTEKSKLVNAHKYYEFMSC